MGHIKLKANKKNKQQKLIDTDCSMLITRGRRVGGRKGKGGQIYGDIILEFIWWVHSAMDR